LFLGIDVCKSLNFCLGNFLTLKLQYGVMRKFPLTCHSLWWLKLEKRSQQAHEMW